MLKVVFPHAFANLGGPIARLVDVHSRGIDSDWMQKRAAVLTTELKAVRPEKGHSFIHLITMGAGEYYGCFAAGMRVWLADGRFVPIEQVCVGDTVVSGHGNVKPVTAVFDNGVREQILEVSLAGLPEPLRVTPNHSVFGLLRKQIACVRQKECRCIPKTQGKAFQCGAKRFASDCDRSSEPLDLTPEKMAIEQLQAGDYVGFKLPKIEAAELMSPEFAWLLGLFVAEGSFEYYTSAAGARSPTQLVFGLNANETALVDQLRGIARDLWNLPVRVRQCSNTPNGIMAIIYSKQIAKIVYDLVGAGSADLRVPLQFFGHPDEVKRAFLSAYAAGDGCSPRPHEIEIVTVSPHLALGVQKLFWSIDVPASVTIRRIAGERMILGRRCHVRDVYHLRASGFDSTPRYSTARSFRWQDWMFVQLTDVTLRTFGEHVYNIEVQDDHSYVVEGVSVGNSNRNGDFFNFKSARFEFPEPAPGGPKSRMLSGGLQEYHKTFMKYAAVYHDHQNKDPKLASGKIVAEAFNPEMQRGELLIKVQNEKWEPELEKLANAEDVAFSMSCKVPFDFCSVCGNQAPSRKEYCDHLKNEMNRVKEAGHQVFAINDRPLFFDISGVFRPADRIAYGLQKVASTGVMPEEFIPSAQIAEMWGISAPRSVLLDGSPRHVQEKLAAMERLAEMEKQIEATGKLHGADLSDGVANCGLDDGSAESMRSVDWNELMGTLSQAKICLPVRDFFRLVLGDKFDSVAGEMDGVQSLLPGIFSRTLENSNEVEDATGMKTYDPASSLVPKSIRDIVEALKPSMSLDEGPARRRISLTILRGGSPDGELRKMSRDLAPSNAASYLAKQYAAYQLAFVRAAEGADDGLVTGLAVLGNYAT